ncbi:hypothetical protein VCRA2121O391_480016 [Vibrio crassostreae]|nr:hypothetical protein VCRA2118O239_110164 [Vibrio crassostreae]CAK1737419.1 hypothetical protein VCRA2110O173_130003 [Vibrio crassostreae]CAK2002159.1 hypothetical protein VCRA2113O207_320019 [Vibrio crassostreae]CAK2013294.1 hypothetical protein VCRA2113O356_300002 [Vibrio crassostreae]CAK2040211.1 hypothetical protein VCRA2113O324_350020 [Vibrio crassostreae]
MFLLSLYFSQTTIHIEINVPWCVVDKLKRQGHFVKRLHNLCFL